MPKGLFGETTMNIKTLKRWVADEQGATAIEYSMIAAAMGLVLVPAMASITDGIDGQFVTIAAYWDNY